ncbi:Beta-N-acetylhexosaminidase [Hexamita inflata]|uniref:beta-N-acetylhexosaminidase n=1 Tax=Hexamita inflata TaxID=28002 RepID=A0ABP1H911_9EUKA
MIIALSLSMVPAVLDQQNKNSFFHLADPKLTCYDSAQQQTCPQYIFDNFEFYKKVMFDRDEPHLPEGYKQIYSAEALQQVKLIIQKLDDVVDIKSVNESYTINVSKSEIIINAATPMASARAFATLSQLPIMDKQNESDQQSYMIQQTVITDKPAAHWRHYSADACAHYMTIPDIQRIISAASIQKLNVLLLTLSCSHSFPLQFTKYPQSRLVYGSWSPRHFYSHSDLQILQTFAQQRGVVLVPELRIPSQTGSWQFANGQLLADCPVLTAQNVNNFVLNPVKELTYQYIEGMIRETVEGLFGPGIRPVIHLGGELVNFQCWEADREINTYMKEKNITGSQLWNEFASKVNAIIEKINPKIIVVWNEAALNNDNKMTPDAIIHYTVNNNKQKSVNMKIHSIHSINWFLSSMHPGGGHHYFWQETWHDLYRQDPNQGCGDFCLGGGAIQPSNNCYARSCEQHSFDRAIGVSDILWKGKTTNAWGETKRMEMLGCKLDNVGIGNGPLDIGAPCPGYIFV